MKKVSILLLFAVCALVATSAFAAQGEMKYGVSGGMAIPMGDFGDVTTAGFQGGVYGDYGVSDNFALGVNVAYNRNNIKDAYETALEDAIVSNLLVLGATSASATVDIKTTILQFGIHGKIMPTLKGSNAMPYLQGGISMYNVKLQSDLSATAIFSGTPVSQSVSESTSDTKIGINGGAGVDFKASPQVTIGVGGMFHNVFTEGSSTTYATLGVNVGFGPAR